MHQGSALTRALTEPEKRAGVNANAGAGGGRTGSKIESSPVDDMVHDTAFDSAPMPLVSAFARLLLVSLQSMLLVSLQSIVRSLRNVHPREC